MDRIKLSNKSCYKLKQLKYKTLKAHYGEKLFSHKNTH